MPNPLKEKLTALAVAAAPSLDTSADTETEDGFEVAQSWRDLGKCHADVAHAGGLRTLVRKGRLPHPIHPLAARQNGRSVSRSA